MEHTILGRTGLLVSRVGFGGGGIGQVWGATTEAESVRAVHRALELGVNFFDVAPSQTCSTDSLRQWCVKLTGLKCALRA